MITSSLLSSILVASGAGVILALGAAHLLLTFRGNRLHPRDPELIALLDEASPRISSETTMWRAWVGFNASHSIGAILFGLHYGYLALAHPTLLFGSPYLLAVGGAVLVGYVVLAKRYWFSAPLRGIVLSTVLYFTGMVTSWL